MSFDLKYRPSTLEEMVGNEDELESLAQQLIKKDRPHVYLFCGESGCGKTTAARIAAQIVGAAGMGLKEINSGNNRGIDSAREIIEQMRYLPAEGVATAYIIDEVHKTTKDFQEAMLKPTEDTPDHVYFFLCTTEPKKLIAPLYKRCAVTNFKPIETGLIKRLVKNVSRHEGLDISGDLCEKIAKKAEGSARTSLKLLEKVAGLTEEKAAKIIANFIDEENAQAIELCRLLLSGGNWTQLATLLKGLKAEDPEEIRRAVMGYAQAVLLNGKENDKAGLMLEMFSEPFYNNGFPGVVLACWQVFSA